MTSITNNLYPTSGLTGGVPTGAPPDPSQFLNNLQALAAQGQSSSNVTSDQQALYAQLAQAASTLQDSSSDRSTKHAARQQVHQLLQQLGIQPQQLMSASSAGVSSVDATDTDDSSVDGVSGSSGCSGYSSVDGFDDGTDQDDLASLTGADSVSSTGSTNLQGGIQAAYQEAMTRLGIDPSTLTRGETLTQAAAAQGVSSDDVTTALTEALENQFPNASDDSAVSGMAQKLANSPHHHHLHAPPPASVDDASDPSAQSNTLSASSFMQNIYA